MAPFHVSSHPILQLKLKELLPFGKHGFPRGKKLAKTDMDFEASAKEKTYIMSAHISLSKTSHMAMPGIGRAENAQSIRRH